MDRVYFDRILDNPTRNGFLSGLALLCTVALGHGCNQLVKTEADNKIQPGRDQIGAVVIKYTYEGEDGLWPIVCHGPETTVRVVAGDKLANLISRNTLTIDSPALGRPNIPPEAVIAAVAESNNLRDPNKIVADQLLELPKYCVPQ